MLPIELGVSASRRNVALGLTAAATAITGAAALVTSVTMHRPTPAPAFALPARVLPAAVPVPPPTTAVAAPVAGSAAPGTARPSPTADTAVAPTAAPRTTLPKAAAPPTTSPRPTPAPPSPVSTTAPTSAAPTAVTAAAATAPRLQPTAAQVQGGIDGLGQYSPLTPSAAQVAQVGDTVCSAFDKGETYAQVVATAQGMVSQIPLVTDVNGATTYAVHEAVSLYCPGYSSKLQ